MMEIIISGVNYSFQQIRASDIWRESEHEDLQHRLLDYHVKVIMRGATSDSPIIKFEGSTDDSMMDIHLRINSYGMKRRDTVICYCRRFNVSHVKLPLHAYLLVRVIIIESLLLNVL